MNYLIQLPDSFHGIRRVFRGVTFDEATGDIVSLPLHKFLNINQAPETQWDILKDQEGVIYEKMDGCLDGKTPVYFCDGTHHPISKVVQQKMPGPIWGLDADNRPVPAFIVDWHKNDLTADWLTVEVDDPHRGKHKRSIACTPDHLFLTNSGYVEAGKLTVGTSVFLLRTCFNHIQKAMVLGFVAGRYEPSEEWWQHVASVAA